MAFAEAMKELVIEIKASKQARHAAVAANKQMTAAMKDENLKWLAEMHRQNREIAANVSAFLKQCRAERTADMKQSMDRIHAEIDSIKQSVAGIRQEANAMRREAREDRKLARQYWFLINSPEPLPPSPGEVPVQATKPTVCPQCGDKTIKGHTCPVSKSMSWSDSEAVTEVANKTQTKEATSVSPRKKKTIGPGKTVTKNPITSRKKKKK
jgi:hypothetical protein